MSNPNIQKHTLNLRRGDWDFIESIAAPHGISTSEVVRDLVRSFVDKKRAELAATKTEETPELDLDL